MLRAPAPTESEVLMRTILYIALLAAVGCDQKDEKPAQPDNTQVNERDQDANTKTPMDQNENSDDIAVTANIRKALMDHDEFSVSARNIKIMTADGVVTLRGPVESEAEKTTIAALARSTQGAKNVVDEIEVKAE